jgi:chaperonin GroES
MVNIQPIADRVLVRPLETDARSKGGVIIPDTAKEKPQMGEVLVVGPGKMQENGDRLAPEVKKGDKVMYTSYAGTEINVDGEKLLLMRESDILAVTG